MVQVSYPGVYIQELPSGVNTITGVATSVAAFFGRTAKGPIDRAVQCFSYSDFLRAFGGPHPASDLGTSVRQFFDNGGSQCWVVRLAHGARASNVTLHNLDTDPVLVATAKNAGAWGDALRLEVDYGTANPDESFNLRVLRMSGEDVEESEEFTSLTMDPDSPRFAPTFVTQSSDLVALALPSGFDPANETTVDGYSESRRIMTGTEWKEKLDAHIYEAAEGERRHNLEMKVDDHGYILIDLSKGGDGNKFDPRSLNQGEVKQELQTRINSQLGSEVPGLSVVVDWTMEGSDRVLRITSSDGGRVHIRRASDADIAAPLMLGLDQGGVELSRFSDLRPAPTGSMFTGNQLALGVKDIDAFDEIEIDGETVELTSNSTHLLNTQGLDPSDPQSGHPHSWREDGLSTDVTDHHDGVREKLSIVATAINETPDLAVRAEVWGYHLALVPTEGMANSRVSVATPTDSAPKFGDGFADNVRRYTLGPAGLDNDYQTPGQGGRDDDGNPPNLEDYRGNRDKGTGFHALDTVDLFNLMVLPRDGDIAEPDHTALLGPASIYCQENRAFLLIDAPPSWTENGRLVAGKAEVDGLRALVVKDHCAVFYPDLLYREGGVQKSIGPSGAIAGLMARIDATRGVWKAPAGTEADVRGISGLTVKLSDMRNGVLNDLAVNCLRVFPSGFVNWGARTFAGAKSISTDWKYVPVRRLALFLEESLYRGTKWIVFEPNDEPLWAKIRLNLNAFMMSLFRQGAFQGDTPDKAFYVKCDSETTTQNDRNQGIVNIEIGFAPLKPAEFVVIKIQQMAGEL